MSTVCQRWLKAVSTVRFAAWVDGGVNQDGDPYGVVDARASTVVSTGCAPTIRTRLTARRLGPAGPRWRVLPLTFHGVFGTRLQTFECSVRHCRSIGGSRGQFWVSRCAIAIRLSAIFFPKPESDFAALGRRRAFPLGRSMSVIGGNSEVSALREFFAVRP